MGVAVARERVALGVATRRDDVRLVGQELEDRDRIGTDRNEIAEGPPSVDPFRRAVGEHRLEGVFQMLHHTTHIFSLFL